MKSRITIEVDFDNGKPYIKVLNDTSSDDVRDKLITHFRQQLGYTSSWLKIIFPFHSDGPITQFHITPITPQLLEEEGRIMLNQAVIDHKIEQAGPTKLTGNTYFVTCAEDDSACCGSFTSNDGQSLAHLKEI